jgi:hypothetical protein
VSLGQAQTTFGTCTVWLDLSPGQLILPTAQFGVLNADGNGQAFLPIPLPNLPPILGAIFYAQWIAADPSGPLAAWGSVWAESATRRIVIW